MISKSSDKPAARGAPVTPATVIWSTFATLALGYLAVAFFIPDWLSDITPVNQTAERQRSELTTSVSQLTADVTSVKAWVRKLQFDSSATKSDVTAQANADKAMTAQMTDLKTRVDALQSWQSSQMVKAPTADATPATPPSETVASNDQEPDEPAAAKVINATKPKSKAESAIETGSVDAAAKPKAKKSSGSVISFGTAVVTPAPKQIGVRIASGSSVDALRLSWSLLSDNHASSLRQLKPHFVDSGDALNPNFDLIAGPVKSKTEAKKICKELSDSAVPCMVGDFKGQAL